MEMLVGAIAEADQENMAECAALWGTENARLPTRKEWAFYDDTWLSRGLMDFEHAEFTAQVLIDPTDHPETAEAAGIDTLHTIVGQALTDTAADLSKRDRVMEDARQKMAERGTPMAAPKSAHRADDNTPVMAEILPADTAARLTPNAVTRTQIVGDDGKRRTMLTYRVPFTEGAYAKLAARYTDTILRESRRFDVPPSLVLAVMETESAFNPRARSAIPAFALMQLVPASAGLDAHRFIKGDAAGAPDPESLYDPDTNIELGTAYLKLLDTRYLRDVEKRESRLYSAIAAYNTGTGNVARAFNNTTNIRTAARIINGLPPSEVFNHLSEQLPFEETRRYLIKVSEARGRYSDWDRVVQTAERP